MAVCSLHRTFDDMGLLTFVLNTTLDGCVDHREGIADEETHAFYTRLMDAAAPLQHGTRQRGGGVALSSGGQLTETPILPGE